MGPRLPIPAPSSSFVNFIITGLTILLSWVNCSGLYLYLEMLPWCSFFTSMIWFTACSRRRYLQGLFIMFNSFKYTPYLCIPTKFNYLWKKFHPVFKVGENFQTRFSPEVKQSISLITHTPQV